jgi:uncharacterized protein YrrD
MLQLSAMILNRPILSLRTGTPVGNTTGAIINPNNLKIEGFYCQVFNKNQALVLVQQDIRDVIPQGIVINDDEVLTEPSDLVRLKKIMDLNFELLGKKVVTESKERIGKVSDFAVETNSMIIKKLYVSQSLLKSFAGGNLGVDRTQIIEITDKKIVIRELSQKVPASVAATA